MELILLLVISDILVRCNISTDIKYCTVYLHTMIKLKFWKPYFLKFCLCGGYGDGFDDVIIQGDLDELRFVAFYTR